jgi:hypothetical protein
MNIGMWAQASMNIIYLECKLLDITKRGFDFIEMSVFNQFLIDNFWFVTVVSQIEGCGGLICHWRGLGCPLGVKTAEADTAGAARVAVPSASSFVLLENEEQFIRPASPTVFLFLIRNQIL